MEIVKKIIAIGLVVIGCGVLASCGSDKTQLNDAPVGQIDDSPAFIMTSADQFPNVSFRCKGKNGIYSTTRTGDDGITIVANDPECGGDPQYTRVGN